MKNNIAFDEDILFRKPLALNLTEVIKENNNINVIALNSAWGTGKTTFIKKWKEMLREDEYSNDFATLYFNAWENDFIKDPMLALITEVKNEIFSIEQCKKNKYCKKSKEVFNEIIINGKKLIKPIINVPLKIASNGCIGVQDLELEAINDKTFEYVVKEKQIRKEFIKKLEVAVRKNDLKVIFFIDELDRCRPTFAIELLETIKHIFDINNIIFIIAIDKEQLAHSIKTLYGQEMDSNGYLRRFFDLEYNMPIIDTWKYIAIKEGRFKNLKKCLNEYYIYLRHIMIIEGYSLRDINKAHDYTKLIIPILNIVLKGKYPESNKAFDKVYGYILASLVNYKFMHNVEFSKISNMNYTTKNLGELLIYEEHILSQIYSGEYISKEEYKFLSKCTKYYLECRKLIQDNVNLTKEESEKYFSLTFINIEEKFLSGKGWICKEVKYNVDIFNDTYTKKLYFIEAMEMMLNLRYE